MALPNSPNRTRPAQPSGDPRRAFGYPDSWVDTAVLDRPPKPDLSAARLIAEALASDDDTLGRAIRRERLP